MNDPYGQGLLSYLHGNDQAAFTVACSIAEPDEWPVSLFFRAFDEMPEIEQKALLNTCGSVLDVGAGAGSHTLWLQQQGIQATALDISLGAVEVMKQRQCAQVEQADYFQFSGQKFDTLLFLMNGIGITGKLERLPLFFQKARELLNPGGKILLDSSDILYMFTEDDGSVMLNLNGDYYGELIYSFNFEQQKGEPFDWLFVDFDTLKSQAKKAGFRCNKIAEDDHFLYLAELTFVN